MGAGQSAGQGHAPVATQEVKTSYYDLLEIEKSATDDDIKKAYRRKALSLHPDRNYGREEAATAEFAAVQSAYEVLSDPQERAWYDSHEDAILRDVDPTASARDGGATFESSVGLTTADDVTRLVRKFHGGVVFDDSPSGFFGFLRDFFDQLVKEEEMAARRQNEVLQDFPSFGHKDDAHNDGVKQFYSAWSGFGTIKSFSWRDKYRANEAEDRRMRRLIEKENMRFRREGIAEFNDAVRSLVAFARKRDPRYQSNTQNETERQKALQDASKAQAARMRAANERARQAAEAPVPIWAQNQEGTTGFGAEEGTFDESSSEEEHFECVACRKTFKSEKQYEAHEKSNKHKKAIQTLRRKLQKEDSHIASDQDLSQGEDEANDRPGDEAEDVTTDELREVKRDDAEQVQAVYDDGSGTGDEMQTNTDTVDGLSSRLESASLSDESQITEDDEELKIHSTPPSTLDTTPPLQPPDQSLPAAARRPKKGKAAQKREKKAAKAAEAEVEGLKFKCAVCEATFPSKSRMHQHIKDFRHAAPQPQGKFRQPGKVQSKSNKDRDI
ncbi:MAG: hypothetical protein Q9159_002582 [Coniocarpon cinnabarinum]